MDITITLIGESAAADLEGLAAWLAEEDELRGRVTVPAPAVRADEMGGIADTLVVALGAQGAGAILATAVSTWIKHRRPSADVEFSREGGMSVKVSVRDANPETVDALVRKALEP
ncbi:hypothetical protein ACIRRH_34760 [Kitasatospora sp. NPDC101235]|uniref:effector-associated constant component EACC1 n=1 Tax=Kitasatospora sp. NPDC101235 TaxID=3364101 RepID=UPI00382DEC63